jgi:hypothetical protein
MLRRGHMPGKGASAGFAEDNGGKARTAGYGGTHKLHTRADSRKGKRRAAPKPPEPKWYERADGKKQKYPEPGSAGTGREGNRSASQALDGPECWKCGRLPQPPDLSPLLSAASMLGLPLTRDQAARWACGFPTVEAAKYGLERLASLACRKKAAALAEKPMPEIPTFDPNQLDHFTFGAVKGPEFVAVLRDLGVYDALARDEQFKRNLSYYANGRALTAELADRICHAAGLHVSDIPRDLLLWSPADANGQLPMEKKAA